jgi:XTP/dITP diphosphohydrolase
MPENTFKIYLATGNAHKVAEFANLLSGSSVHILSARAIGGMPAVEESAKTFEGNALLKAQALYALAPQGTWVMADDSGLETDALEGAPGVRSARFAGIDASDSDNCQLLLQKLTGIEREQRTARFRCVIALLGPEGDRPIFFSGSCEGTIAFAPSGNGGFGYDPLFIPQGHTDSFAALPAEIKASISHRAAAIKKFSDWLKKF